MEILLQEIQSQLDPFEIYSVFKDEKYVAFLDSSLVNQELGKYSFVGINPFLTLKGIGSTNYINGEVHQYDIFNKISELMEEYKTDNQTGIPFIGGCIGYLSYDLGIGLEGILVSSVEDILLPSFYFVFYDNLIIFDHEHQKTYISACGRLDGHLSSILSIEARIASGDKIIYSDIPKSEAVFESNFTREEYVNTIKKVKSYIENGDIYIANLTQRFTSKCSRSSYDIYKDLRRINPAAFSVLMKLDGFDIISSSPERFLKIEQGAVETRPIKGTRPRGQTEEEDMLNRLALLNSEKDRAELLMIVDLERNDLSKVCKPHSIKVTQLYKLEEYSTVFHLVSIIKGQLKDKVDAVSCLQACFPGGSITGTPKIRAMEIIDELEGLKRSIYTGCIGYFSFDGNADFNIVIRTIIKQDDQVYFGVGGGITWDSDEDAEYQETLDKAKALMRVI